MSDSMRKGKGTEAICRRWSWVAWSMAAGATYDLTFAVAMLAFHERAARILGLAPPGDPLYLRFSGLLLLLLGSLYLLPASSPVRYQGVVLVAACGRFAGFCFLVAAWRAGQGPVFLGLGLMDLVFALLHALLLVRARAAGSMLP